MHHLDPTSALARLFDAPVRPGVVTWIGARTARRQPMAIVQHATLAVESGLEGDRYSSSGTRQITLIQDEHLVAIGAYLGTGPVDPALIRRNIVVRGINLLALKGRQFQLGTAVLQATGECHPCSRMEEIFGPGGYNAVRGHGGITARVLTAGQVQPGDTLRRVTF